MPHNRPEPRIYTGNIVMLMGAHAGNAVPMPYTTAQGLVANGQARWEDDESPLPRQFAAEIAKRDAAAEQAKADDAAHAAKLLAEKNGTTPKDVTTATGVISVATTDGETGRKLYLGRPFPQRAEFAPEVIGTKDGDYGVSAIEDGMIALIFANAEATYVVVEETPGDFIYGVLREKKEPEVEIPADWRDLHHLKVISLAKAVRGLDNKAKMSKDDAIAVLEEWTKVDDQVSAEDAGAGADGEARNENGRILDGEQAPEVKEGEDGKQVVAKTPEEIAAESERKILEDDGF